MKFRLPFSIALYLSDENHPNSEWVGFIHGGHVYGDTPALVLDRMTAVYTPEVIARYTR